MPASWDLDESDKPLTAEELSSKLERFDGYKASIVSNIENLELKRQRLKNDVNEYAQLVQNVEKLVKDGTASFESRVDLGCEVTVAARIPDTRTLYVAVGLGFHVEVALAEVSELVEPRRKHLGSQLAEVEQQLADARATAQAFDSSLRLLREGLA